MAEPDSNETLSYSKLTVHRKTRTGSNLTLTQQYEKTYLTIFFGHSL